MTLQVFPASSQDDSADGRLSYAIGDGQSRLRGSLICPASTNLQDDYSRQLGIPVLIAASRLRMCPRPVAVSSCESIGHPVRPVIGAGREPLGMRTSPVAVTKAIPFRMQEGTASFPTGPAVRPRVAPVSIPGRHAPLRVSIPHIVGLGSEPQMIRATALSSVTSMAREEAIWDWSDGQLPSEAVCPSRSTVDLKDPVAICEAGGCPEPTAVRVFGFGDLGPEAGDQLGGILGLHREPPTRGVTPRVVSATPGHFAASIIPHYQEGG